MSIKHFLSQDHRDCDEAFANFENSVNDGRWNESEVLFATMKMLFIKHFAMEEEVMFIEFEAASGMSCGPTQVMRMEHEHIRITLNKLENELHSRNQNSVLGFCETLNILIQQHNSKEEQILYTMADNILKADDIVPRMQNVR
jgi:DUF438 domain-containing protein